MKLLTVGFFSLFSLVLILGGCAGIETDQTLHSGMGTIYSPCSDTTPCATYSVTIHFEDRPDEGAVQTLARVINNMTPAQISKSALLSPERMLGEIVGGDRREVNIAVQIPNPHLHDMNAIIATVNESLINAKVDARISVHGIESPPPTMNE